MAANVPAKLRSADLVRFAQRAAQVEKVKPPIAYWCYYWMVQSILGKSLHNQDDECKQYTTTLIDKLEEFKSANVDNDAITDDVAGQAYVEQFALETFQRADNTMSANKVTRQTADTFQAAATFLDITHIWGPPNQEMTAKIKYAKFHALRIAKALKAGEDPNAGNPAPTPTPDPQDVSALDPNDPEVKNINNASLHATVEDAPDDTDRLRSEAAARSIVDQSLHPSREASTTRGPSARHLPPGGDNGLPLNPTNAPLSPADQHTPLTNLSAQEISNAAPPMSPIVPTAGNQDASMGSSITPQVQPDHLQTGANEESQHVSARGSDFPAFQLPEVPSDPSGSAPAPSGPLSPEAFVTPSIGQPAPNAHEFYTNPTQPPTAPAAPLSPPAPQAGTTPQGYHLPPPPPPASQPSPYQPQQYVAAPSHASVPYRQQAPSPAISQPPAAATNYVTDDLAMVNAQKHAKWAISALNFEDVPTAVKELREALRALGAS